eukprot:1638463-Pyramimonas_sp.AAC.1
MAAQPPRGGSAKMNCERPGLRRQKLHAMSMYRIGPIGVLLRTLLRLRFWERPLSLSHFCNFLSPRLVQDKGRDIP